MGDPRSKLDILYQDVLGDIHDILTKVDGLKTELPATADAMADKLAGVLQGIATASSDARAAARSAETLCKSLAADRQKLVGDVEAGIKRSVRAASRGQLCVDTVSKSGMPYIPAWYALAALVCGIALTLLVGAWSGKFSWEHSQEAAIGRSFMRSLPTLDPEVKAKLIENMRKNSA